MRGDSGTVLCFKLVRQVVLVPPCNGEVRQDDTRMSSLGEWIVSKLCGGHSQGAVLDDRENPYILVKCLHLVDVHSNGQFLL